MNAIEAITAEMNELEASFSRLPVAMAGSKNAASGTLAAWQEHVAAPAVGDDLAVLAISLAFAGPLLSIVGGSNVGVSFVGPSGVGKTQKARLMASVWGSPGKMIHSSNATPAALEAIAAAADGRMVIFDELDRGHDPAGIIRMLHDGHGKLRARRDGVKQQATFRLAFMTTSESDYAPRNGGSASSVTIKMNTRSQAIPAIAEAAERFHGTAGPAFLAAMAERTEVSGADFIWDAFDAVHYQIIGDIFPSHEDDGQSYEDDGTSERVRQMTHIAWACACQMATIAAAGEAATHLGILPWPAGTAIRAVMNVFNGMGAKMTPQ
ncbi:DUF927 domain-containing protein [Gluconacetobacter diazotrophicus]|uniref:DUF927 domain-containing protein n=1 Tax=Gluconacetobacter diazotrophicus TaxID=33996 RepID=A0A7W4I3I9_GLUDI|nr:DUF927 domain-containing protein [Gluconacetobacter diazotrophicus]MBB2154831.1 DUF927 domain-containing protein [Gluconacetobacter diazotrophicus]